ncbi:MAG: beta-lactamase family protein, partial [Planctomycetaceae bacterium]|nr:beta-lactamase family protein [Planctomycetaceae bacterium]
MWLLIGLSLPAAEPNVSNALQPFVESGSLAGAVTAVANKDKVLSVETVGYMDVGAKQAMKADCLFWIASMSKPITGTAVMLLVDEGKVKLDDPIEKYLPEFKGMWVAVEKDADHVLLKHPSRLVTVRDVMSHTSGMPFKSDMEQP